MVLDTAEHNNARFTLVKFNHGMFTPTYDIVISLDRGDGHKPNICQRIGEDELVNWEDMARARLDRYLARTGGAQTPSREHQA
jgi:hypothetical protein